jgi:uncharacterized CHY-type Zn-finger protein
MRRYYPKTLSLALVLLLGVAIGTSLASDKGEKAASLSEVPTTPDLDDRHLDKTPPREPVGLDLKKVGWSYDCMECHRMIDKKWERGFELVEHDTIDFKHGNNRYCFNCHHQENRDAFVDYDGSEIPSNDINVLCAKCHGPKNRDWEAGVHGRLNGYWDPDKGPQTKLGCIQCHDPHHPSFKAIKPLSPPTYPKRATGNPSSGEGH